MAATESNIISLNFATSAPCDLDLERSLLSAIIADNALLDKIPQLQPDMLHDPIHANVMKSILDLRQEGRPINLVTLKPRWGAVPFATGGTVFEYLRTFEFAGTLPNIVDISDGLIELHQRRLFLDIGERMTASAGDPSIGPGPLISSFLSELDDLQAQTKPVGKTLWKADDAVDDLFDQILNGTKVDAAPTGFVDLDEFIGGWRESTYVVLAGRPSMGKTALAVSLARKAALGGHGVGIFSLEMSKDQWMTRTICDQAWVGVDDKAPLKSALRRTMNDHEFDLFSTAGKIIRGLPLVIDESSGLTAADIAAGVRQMAEEFRKDGKRLRMVIIDHMGKVMPSGRYKGNRVQEVTELSNALHEIAKTERITLVALCQLNRAVEGRDNKRAGLSDLRESGAIEQDADIVIFPFRPAYYLERAKENTAEEEAVRMAELRMVQNLLEINIAKQRNGQTGGFELFVDMSANAIRDAAKIDPSTTVYSAMSR